MVRSVFGHGQGWETIDQPLEVSYVFRLTFDRHAFQDGWCVRLYTNKFNQHQISFSAVLHNAGRACRPTALVIEVECILFTHTTF